MVLFCFNNVTAYADTVSATPYLNNAILEDEIELCIGTSTSIDVSNESGILLNVQSKNENVAHATLSGSQFYSVINVTATGLGSTEIELVDSTENTVIDVLKVNVVGANVLAYFDTDNVSIVKGKTCTVSYTVDCDVSSDCYELGIVSRDISVATVEAPYSYSNSFKITAVALGETIIDIVDVKNNNKLLASIGVKVTDPVINISLESSLVNLTFNSARDSYKTIDMTVDTEERYSSYSLAAVSRNSLVATAEVRYSSSIKVYAVGIGETIIDIVDTKNNNKVLASFTVNVSKQSNEITTQYTHAVRFVKNKVQKVKVNASAKDNAKLSFKSSNKKVKVNKKGIVKLPKKFHGKVVITITCADTDQYSSVSKEYVITVGYEPKFAVRLSYDLRKFTNHAHLYIKNKGKKKVKICNSMLFYPYKDAKYSKAQIIPIETFDSSRLFGAAKIAMMQKEIEYTNKLLSYSKVIKRRKASNMVVYFDMDRLCQKSASVAIDFEYDGVKYSAVIRSDGSYTYKIK